MRIATGRLLGCAIFLVALSAEVRISDDTGQTICCRYVSGIGRAHDIAEQWRRSLLAAGAVEELAVLTPKDPHARLRADDSHGGS